MALKKSVQLSNTNADSGVNAATQMSQNPNEDFVSAPLTPDQQAEQDTLDGHNAALRAINGSVPEINKLNHSVFKLKSDMSFKDFLKLSPEEQKAQFLSETSKNNARKRQVNSNTMGDEQPVDSQDSTQGL